MIPQIMIIHSGFSDVTSEYIQTPIKMEQKQQSIDQCTKYIPTYKKTGWSGSSESILEIIKKESPKHKIIPIDIENGYISAGSSDTCINSVRMAKQISQSSKTEKFVVNYCIAHYIKKDDVYVYNTIVFSREFDELAKLDNVIAVVAAGNGGKVLDPSKNNAAIYPQCLTEKEGIVVVGSINETTRKVAEFSNRHDKIFYYPHNVDKEENQATRVAASLMTSYVANNWKDQSKSEMIEHLKGKFSLKNFM